MAEPLLLTAAFVSSVGGMGWLALAMRPHWAQARGAAPYSATTGRRLRAAGGAALVLSLGLCLRADHPSMAALVWVMSVSASALIVAMVLAFRPRWLAWLAGGSGKAA